MKFLCISAILAAMALPASATTMVSSDFEDGTLGGWALSSGSVGFDLINPGSGGNPGGYLQMVDTLAGGAGGLVEAPSQYHGDLSGFTSVSWDSRSPITANNIRFIVRGSASTYVYNPGTAGLLANTWQSWTANLDGGTGWTQISGSADFMTMLKSVTLFAFTLEIATTIGNEASLDNVKLNPKVQQPSAIPLPAPILLLAGSLCAFSLLGNRSRKKT